MICLNEIDPLDSNIRNWKFHGEIGSGWYSLAHETNWNTWLHDPHNGQRLQKRLPSFVGTPEWTLLSLL